jgi:hypothetical protein
MASGTFPLSANSVSGQKLRVAVGLVRQVLAAAAEEIEYETQLDNAMSDGGSMARLELAVRLIEAEVQ